VQAYIAKRLLLFPLTLLVASVIIFLIMRVLPGDPVLLVLGEAAGTVTREEIEEARRALGLDRPLWVQYGSWLWGVLRLDPGQSLRNRAPIREEFLQRLPLTLHLAVLTMVIALTVSTPAGVLAARKRGTWIDYIVRLWALLGLALPTFWMGLLVLLLLSVFLNWLPPLVFRPVWRDPVTSFSQLIWPALVLGFFLTGILMRLCRAQMLEVLRQDYIRTAWAKGLLPRLVLTRHALRNAILPVVTVAGIQFGHVLGGTVITEQIFNLQGLGQFLLVSIHARDYAAVQFLIAFYTFVFMVVNLVVDLLYSVLDPRIRLG